MFISVSNFKRVPFQDLSCQRICLRFMKFYVNNEMFLTSLLEDFMFDFYNFQMIHTISLLKFNIIKS